MRHNHGTAAHPYPGRSLLPAGTGTLRLKSSTSGRSLLGGRSGWSRSGGCPFGSTGSVAGPVRGAQPLSRRQKPGKAASLVEAGSCRKKSRKSAQQPQEPARTETRSHCDAYSLSLALANPPERSRKWRISRSWISAATSSTSTTAQRRMRQPCTMPLRQSISSSSRKPGLGR